MYEVELKAWLENRKSVENTLKNIAHYDGFFDKTDTYYHLDEKNLTVRIRKEIVTRPENNNPQKDILVTYKKKEKRVSENNETYEVNLEKEFEISSAEEFADILTDSGYSISLSKHKCTESWYAAPFKDKTEYHIELCEIENLGSFIEIETLTEDNTENNVKTLRDGLLKVLDLLGVPRSKIEPRYYKELLKENSLLNK